MHLYKWLDYIFYLVWSCTYPLNFLSCRTLSINLKMFHTEFYKGKSLQEVNAFDSEGAVLNIIIDGKWRERERERERITFIFSPKNTLINLNNCLNLFQIFIQNLHKQDLQIYWKWKLNARYISFFNFMCHYYITVLNGASVVFLPLSSC